MFPRIESSSLENYTDTDVNQQGADSRLAGCLLSLHVYNYQTTAVVEQPWRDYLKTHVGSNYGRTIATEYGAVMTTGNRLFQCGQLAPHP